MTEETNDTTKNSKTKTTKAAPSETEKHVFLWRLCPILATDSLSVGGRDFAPNVPGSEIRNPWFLTTSKDQARWLRGYRIDIPSGQGPGAFDVVEGSLLEAVAQAVEMNRRYAEGPAPCGVETRRLDPAHHGTGYDPRIGSHCFPIDGRRITEEEFRQALARFEDTLPPLADDQPLPREFYDFAGVATSPFNPTPSPFFPRSE